MGPKGSPTGGGLGVVLNHALLPPAESLAALTKSTELRVHEVISVGEVFFVMPDSMAGLPAL